MPLTTRLQNLPAAHCGPVLDDAHPVTVVAIGGQEHWGFEGACAPGDKGLLLRTPCRHGTDLHGHQPFAAVLVGEKPLPADVTRVVRGGDEPIMAGEGAVRD
jgi:hypothetical protein